MRAQVEQRAVRVSTARFRLRPRTLLEATAADAAAAGSSSQLSPHSLGCSKPRGPPRLLKNAVRYARYRARTRRLLISALLRLCLVVSRERIAAGDAPRWWHPTPASGVAILCTQPRSPQVFAATAFSWFAWVRLRARQAMGASTQRPRCQELTCSGQLRHASGRPRAQVASSSRRHNNHYQSASASRSAARSLSSSKSVWVRSAATERRPLRAARARVPTGKFQVKVSE